MKRPWVSHKKNKRYLGHLSANCNFINLVYMVKIRNYRRKNKVQAFIDYERTARIPLIVSLLRNFIAQLETRNENRICTRMEALVILFILFWYLYEYGTKSTLIDIGVIIISEDCTGFIIACASTIFTAGKTMETLTVENFNNGSYRVQEILRECQNHHTFNQVNKGIVIFWLWLIQQRNIFWVISVPLTDKKNARMMKLLSYLRTSTSFYWRDRHLRVFICFPEVVITFLIHSCLNIKFHTTDYLCKKR